MNETKLKLNFIAVAGPFSDYTIYRERASEGEKKTDVQIPRYRLLNSDMKREDAWVSLTPRDGFTSQQIVAGSNINLTKWSLCTCLQEKAKAIFGDKVWSADHGFLKEVAITIAQHKEGREELILQPYYLSSEKCFGFLVDFHFRVKPGEPFSRRIQQLSLSLDSQNRRNANFYTDKREKIASFLKAHFHDLFPLELPSQTHATEFQRAFFSINADVLTRKRYVVGGQQERIGPFAGIREKGPWAGVASTPPLVFIFRESEREAARYLLRALRGNFATLNFDGFEKMFRAELPVSEKPVVLSDFAIKEMSRAVKCIKEFEVPVLPVLVLPHEEPEESYAIHKALFASEGIPTQVCTTHTISDSYTLKWSIANLALQIFCKAGGRPWRIKSSSNDCLIVGIGQAHRMEIYEGKRRVQKYFAFSILTDSSGLFQSVEMLGDSPDEMQYLDSLRINLGHLLKTSAAKFSKVVLHTPFKLKQSEMKVLEEEVRHVAGVTASCKFAVVKINQHNRFFAFNEGVNSLIPYEGTYSALDKDEFLIWFEGLFPDKPTASKAVPGPTHVKFLRVSHPDLVADTSILQDLLNLSGANWRGFNSKSTPVSVLYCRLVADLVSSFQEMKLPMPAVHTINPWFL